MHIEARLLARKLLVKCGVFWYQMASNMEAFNINLVTTIYRDIALSAGG